MNRYIFLLTIPILFEGEHLFAQEYPHKATFTKAISVGELVDQKVINSITISQTVSKGAVAQYSAGNSITLQPGFTAYAGSVFEATISSINSIGKIQEVTNVRIDAYPNPFVSRAIIRYSLPMTSSVKHTLTDEQGKIIQQHTEAVDPSETDRQVQIDGLYLKTGVYFYRVEGGDRSQSIRLIKK
ncbi:putative secreted protein (Por secretion system target) [Spirosoma oryzae]|uniref:Putative secreted protein (Por secretion system target) n=1 Tax=Spirosoma oryzae TaxID=1469603 RepID=A0A2T0T2Q4_9BACT|nr:T9SS type A sorting domain-containing protein [Spirosoma oryzae]PRY39909.1 putative secreted protein (Por secretion system target) [Spirosoma oryzae]